MRTATETRATTDKNGKKTVTTTTTTYLKIGDIIGAAKNAYDLGQRLRNKKGVITKTLKTYGASYAASLLNPLIVLIKGMDIYKKILSVVEIVTPIAQTVARATGVWSSPGNVGDIASILLGVVNKILIQIATIFIIKMKDIIWNFEFKIKQTSETATSIISQAVYNTNNQCYEITNNKTKQDTKEDGSRKDPPEDNSNAGNGNDNNTDSGSGTGGTGDSGDGDDYLYKYSKYNEGIEYKEKKDGVWDEEWKKSNYADGSFRAVIEHNGILLAFSYEGENCDSKPYGIIYSKNKGKYWEPINNTYKDFYVYDAGFLEDNLNFSAYGAVAKKTGVTKKVMTDRGVETLKEYKLLDCLSPYFSNYTIYLREYKEDEKTIYEYYYNIDMLNSDDKAVVNDITNNSLIIKAEKFAITTVTVADDKTVTFSDFIDAKDPEGNIKFDTSNNYISSYGINNLIFDTMFVDDVELTVEVVEPTFEIKIWE